MLHSEQFWFCLHSSVVGQAACSLLLHSWLKYVFEKTSAWGLCENHQKGHRVNNTRKRTDVILVLARAYSKEASFILCQYCKKSFIATQDVSSWSITSPESFSSPKLQMCWKHKFASLMFALVSLDCNGMQPVCISEFICIPSNPSFVAFFVECLIFLVALCCSSSLRFLFFSLSSSSWYYFYSWVQPHWRTAGYWWQGGSSCYIPKGTWGMWVTSVVLNSLINLA